MGEAISSLQCLLPVLCQKFLIPYLEASGHEFSLALLSVQVVRVHGARQQQHTLGHHKAQGVAGCLTLQFRLLCASEVALVLLLHLRCDELRCEVMAQFWHLHITSTIARPQSTCEFRLV